MSRLLEIFGRAITVDAADLIWHWLNMVLLSRGHAETAQNHQFNKAIELIGEKKFDAATCQLRLYLFENPDCIYGRLAAGAICLHNNQLTEAIKELNSVYLRRPNNTIALYALGHCYERLGKESQAVEFYQDCLKFKKYLQLPAQRLAAIYFKNCQIDKTIQQYELLKTEYPEDISTLIILGYLYIHTGRYTEAVETFTKAILMHPDNFHSDSDIDRLIDNGQLHEALEQIEESIRIHPDRPDLMIKYGDVLGMLSLTADAVAQYEQAVNLCPDFLEARIKLGMHYLQLQQELLAAEQFNLAVEINDNIVDGYIGLAISQQLSGHYSDALGTLSLAAAIQPNSSILFTETSCLHLKLGLYLTESFKYNYDEDNLTYAVIEAHRQQILLSKHNPDLFYRYGILMMGVYRYEEAIASFENALNINPFFARSLNKLAVCLSQLGRQDEAIERLICTNPLDNKTLFLHYKTSLLYCDKLKFASSLFNLERNFESNLTNSNAIVNVSIILQNLNLLDRSSAMWDNISETTSRAINSNNPFLL